MAGTKCLLCGEIVYGLCPGINAIPGVVCENYQKMMQQRFYDWVVEQTEKRTKSAPVTPPPSKNPDK